MLVGDPQEWANRFVGLEDRLIFRIVDLWPACLAALPPQPEEDTITINLVHFLSNDSVIRKLCYWVAYQHEPFGTHPNGAKYSKGKIDLAFFLDREREHYLAYECKRLNVIHNGARSSLATPYVMSGLLRFVTEQYAEALPVGCMLGYVIDRDLPFAKSQLDAAISTNQVPIGLSSGPTVTSSSSDIQRFSTTHVRANKTAIEVRHTLLAFPPPRASASTASR